MMLMRVLVFIYISIPPVISQYGMGMYSGYPTGMPYGYGDPFLASSYGDESSQRDCRGLPSMRARSICRYGTGGIGSQPMMMNQMMMGGTMGMGCVDLSPQCSVWASTGQCATNPMMMRQSCALSCGTCATGLGVGGGGGSSFYNPFSVGMNGLGGPMAGLSQFIGRSIYETGILRQPTPHKELGRTVMKNGYIPTTPL